METAEMAWAAPRIVDVVDFQKPFFSLEFFPPKTDEGFRNLLDRIERMKKLGPGWVDVTWGAGGRSADRSLELAVTVQQELQLPVMMHLTCSNVPKEAVAEALRQAKDAGIRNILALRGDPVLAGLSDTPVDSFQHAIELVQFIRANYGDHFCIAVAGYPEGHFESKSFDADIDHLKAKVEAGADFIVSQLFYDVEIFNMFVRECTEAGIRVPIVAGLMPIYSFDRFNRITHLTQVIVPDDVIRTLYALRMDDEAVRKYGVEYMVNMIRSLRATGINGFHFYTLNLEKSVVHILSESSLLKSDDMPMLNMVRTTLDDCRPDLCELQEHELKTTPLAISRYRPKEFYMNTTKFDWDDFPHERWGDSRSAAYMSFLDDIWYASLQNSKIRSDLNLTPADIITESDVNSIFVEFINGKLRALPWTPEPVSTESTSILADLVALNRAGILTICSQPAVDGVPASDAKYGWGPPEGYVYQKAFVEFFCSPSMWQALQRILPSNMQYIAVQQTGEPTVSARFGPTALTWGVFPDSEVVESTRLEPENFLLWREQAFSLWTTAWAAHLSGKAREVLLNIQRTYWLVNVVQDDYKNGPFFPLLRGLVEKL